MVERFKTVRELIADLQRLPQDCPVALSSDEEGNNVRLINGVGTQKVERLQYQYMDTIADEDLEDHDHWVLIAEVW